MKWAPPIISSAAAGGEGKAVVFKSKLKWVGLVGLVLSTLSLFTHFLLARYTAGTALSEYQSSITIFSWRPIFDTAHLSTTVMCNSKISYFYSVSAGISFVLAV